MIGVFSPKNKRIFVMLFFIIIAFIALGIFLALSADIDTRFGGYIFIVLAIFLFSFVFVGAYYRLSWSVRVDDKKLYVKHLLQKQKVFNHADIDDVIAYRQAEFGFGTLCIYLKDGTSVLVHGLLNYIELATYVKKFLPLKKKKEYDVSRMEKDYIDKKKKNGRLIWTVVLLCVAIAVAIALAIILTSGKNMNDFTQNDFIVIYIFVGIFISLLAVIFIPLVKLLRDSNIINSSLPLIYQAKCYCAPLPANDIIAIYVSLDYSARTIITCNNLNPKEFFCIYEGFMYWRGKFVSFSEVSERYGSYSELLKKEKFKTGSIEVTQAFIDN